MIASLNCELSDIVTAKEIGRMTVDELENTIIAYENAKSIYRKLVFESTNSFGASRYESDCFSSISKALDRLYSERIRRRRQLDGVVLKGKVQYIDIHNDFDKAYKNSTGFSLHGISI